MIPTRTIVAVVTVGVLLAAGAGPAAAAEEPPSLALASGEIVDINGDTVGGAFAIDDGTSTTWIVFAEGLEPGLHGLQLHETGDCDSPLESIGPRIESAALATLGTGADGATESMFTTASNGVADLADGDGFSLVVHDQPDNRANVPDRYQSTESSEPGADTETVATGDVGSAAACAEMEVDSGLSRPEAERTRAQWARSAHTRMATRMAPSTRAGAPRAPRAAIDYLQADMVDGTGARRGRVLLLAGEADGTDAIAPMTTGVEPGVYAVQIHSGGSCTGTDFADAGPRLSGADLPDLITAEAAAGPSPSTLTLSTADLPSLAGLLEGDGATVVVHSNPDNHANIPDRYTADGAGAPGPDATTQATGDAGVGIACGRLRTVPPAERYIDTIYNWMLERPVEPSATALWTDYLARRGRASFVATVMDSLEARRKFVGAAYAFFLGTTPDPAGLAYWTGQLARPRFNEDALIASLLGTSRFYDNAGGTNGDFVFQLFFAVLDRDPRSGEESLWTTYLARGGSRRAMAAQLLGSIEARTLTVVGAYFSATDREPEPAELAIWLEYLRRGGRYRELRIFLLAGDEFYAWAISSPLPTGGFFFIL